MSFIFVSLQACAGYCFGCADDTHAHPPTPTHTHTYCCPCLASFAIASLAQSERHLPCNYNSVQLGNLSVRLKAATADAADVAAAFATQQKKGG